MTSGKRKTLTKGGRVTQVPVGKYLYLGRTVTQIDPRGYSHVSEVKGTAQRIKIEMKRGVISRGTANARLMRLNGIVEQTKLGELKLKTNKIKAKRAINKVRRELGFKPVSLSIGPKRPTWKQRHPTRKKKKKGKKR